MKKCTLTIAVLLIASFSFANIRLPAVLNNEMVLQQNAKVKLWGWSDPGEKIYITTSWNNKTDSTLGTQNANWQIAVQTPTAGGPYTISFKGRNKIELNNVLIGEVWVCSGQSNMEFSMLNGIKEIKNELPDCYNNQIRFFKIAKTTSEYPQDNCNGSWAVCDSNSLKSFSAVAYYFGKKLNKEMGVPIGLISSNWGGTPAEVWTPEDVLNNDADLKDAAKKINEVPWWPVKPGATYNAMIAPITNFSIAGTIWYQGESNVETAGTYDKLMTTLIDSWRKKWNIDFPFYYVQIAPFKYGSLNTAALLREAQTQTMKHANAGMVVISDLVSDTTDIHPQNKHDVGDRLANWALGKTYQKTGFAYKSPLYKDLKIDKNRAIISFTDAEKGLQAEGVIKEIYVAGADKIFYKADAKIDKSNLIVWRKEVANPVAVRYAFSNSGIGNLFSKEGLPVNAFRTDNWEVYTGK